MKRRVISEQRIKGPITFDGMVIFERCVEIKGYLQCDAVETKGNLRIEDELYVKRDVKVEGDLMVVGSICVGGDMLVRRDFHVQDYLSVYGDLDILGNLYTGKGLDPTRDIAVGGRFRVSGESISQC